MQTLRDLSTLEINQGNELIATYMGWKYKEWQYEPFECNNWVRHWVTNDEDEFIVYCDDFTREYYTIPFSYSWDWLMPVVEKIENNPLITMRIEGNKCIITDIQVLNNLVSKNKCYYNEVVTENKQFSIWMAIVEFLKYQLL